MGEVEVVELVVEMVDMLDMIVVQVYDVVEQVIVVVGQDFLLLYLFFEVVEVSGVVGEIGVD